MEGDIRKVIIYPDVHGRRFWRRGARFFGEGVRHIFLGDYLDPYERECIGWDEAMGEFQDILSLAKEHPDEVTLLLGNHDLHYLFNDLAGTRRNRFEAASVRSILLENMDLFKMADEVTLGGRRYLFSHAGVHRSWHLIHDNIFGKLEDLCADTFNSLMFTKEFVGALSDVGFIRGGWDAVGSMVWADIHEFEEPDALIPGLVQVVGHSMQVAPKVIDEGIYCLDCSRCFVLDESGIRMMV